MSLDWHPSGHCAVCRRDPDNIPAPAGGKVCAFLPKKSKFVPQEKHICQDTTTIKDFKAGGVFMQWPAHCIQGNPGAEFTSDLHVPGSAFIVKKGYELDKDSYSAWPGKVVDRGSLYDPLSTETAASLTSFRDHAKTQKIKRFFVVGLALDYCVMNTALDMIRDSQGKYAVTVLLQGTKPVTPATGSEAVQKLINHGVRVHYHYELQVCHRLREQLRKLKEKVGALVHW
jgi:nicotinamidase-related amidase